MKKLKGNRIALVFGIFLAAVHAIWALAVAVIPEMLQNGINWIFKVHFLNPYLQITAFNFLDSIMLVIVTFAFGYLLGWIFVFCWNLLHKK